ncbi:MAG: hypothetical protein NC548_25080 [Lachnospiraceae bacterium]|nr:hypothetical protein [Lachnospiraceae bacterium]
MNTSITLPRSLNQRFKRSHLYPQIGQTCKESEVIVLTEQITDEINTLVARLSAFPTLRSST